MSLIETGDSSAGDSDRSQFSEAVLDQEHAAKASLSPVFSTGFLSFSTDDSVPSNGDGCHSEARLRRRSTSRGRRCGRSIDI
jgi:hypothetical protein